MQRTATRGRKPEIATACKDASEVRRQAKSLVTAIRRLEKRLAVLDQFYSRQPVSRSGGQPKPGRKPNVRDLAAEILSRSKKPMALAILADRVAKARGKKSSKMFAMNLGTALRKDQRFRRVGRGVYGLCRSES